ncbi:2-hydroxychromene-2-carboxylate isomerase [Chachezhania sediminis]|uniref:2-hydroxychromene-2-carboxylate isomerase n=1 Tax=Chachezhania sediminis TaxID=2599291 RepID=UPI00131BBFB7|nr:2-hydroxychromene-2-carboxylate isomerase [Chachezhania sediminis]
MARLVFCFDFASPYAYAAFDATVALAEEAGCTLELRPAMVWAILKAQGIMPPLERPARQAYMARDMPRTAAFHGLPYAPREPLAISAHLALRMWLGLTGGDIATGAELGRRLFAARFGEGLNITDPEVLVDVALAAGYDAEAARTAMQSDATKAGLRTSIDAALADGAVGVPFYLLDGEPFFGVDRLPQLRWRLGLEA